MSTEGPRAIAETSDDLSSHVSRIIGSREPPSEADMVLIREAMHAIDLESVQLDQDIVNTETTLTQMKQRRVLLQRNRDACATSLVPIGCLPPELLNEIFLICLLQSPETSLHSNFPIPLLLGQVCRRWRALTLSLGRLWCSMTLTLNEKHPQAQAAQVKRWLARSAGYPLSIRLRHDDFGYTTKNTHPLIDALLEYSHLWEEIEFYLPVSLLSAFSCAEGRLDSLQRLSIYVPDHRRLTPDPLEVFAVAPQLHSVMLHVHPSELQLPWEQLTECTLSFSIYNVLEFIRQTPHLTKCSLHNCSWGHSIHETPPDFPINSNMTSLRLTQTTYSSGVFIFAYLTLPSLRDLEIDLLDETNWPRDDFMSFLERSTCPLERLALLTVTLIFNDLIACLQALPSLMELEIDRVYTLEREGRERLPNDELLGRLDPRKASEQSGWHPLLPRLQVIKLSGLLNCRDDILADMIESRRCDPTVVSRLKSVWLRYSREWDRNAISRVEAFAVEGLKFTVEENQSMSPRMRESFPGLSE